MTNVVAALTTEIENARQLMGSLTPHEWASPSGCTDWSVQDVVCHMASVFHSIADPTSIEGGSSADVEQNAEVPVQARRSWTAQQVMAEYHEWSATGLATLTAFQEPPLADTVIPLANLGSHPMRLLANALCSITTVICATTSATPLPGQPSFHRMHRYWRPPWNGCWPVFPRCASLHWPSVRRASTCHSSARPQVRGH